MPKNIGPVRIGMILIALALAGSLLGCGSDVTRDSTAGSLRAGPPTQRELQAFVAEAKFDSCLPPDRSYADHGYGFAPDHSCARRPWTPERQRRYCERRLDGGNPHIDYCSAVAAEWAYPTLLLTKLPELIERICNDNAEHLRSPYDETIDEFYRAVRDRERAGLDRIYDEVYWPRTGEEIDC